MIDLRPRNFKINHFIHILRWKLLIASHQLENVILVEFRKCFLNIVPEVDASLLVSCCTGVLVFKWGEADDVSTACHLVGVLINVITDLWLVWCSLGERHTDSCWLGVGSFVGETRHTWATANRCCLGGVQMGDGRILTWRAFRISYKCCNSFLLSYPFHLFFLLNHPFYLFFSLKKK